MITVKNKTLLIITGPTGVGKSNLAEQLALQVGGEIINGDMGQMYTHLTIGTAKPDWRHAESKHHLFDIFDQPTYCTVTEYRRIVADVVADCYARNVVPIIVGGSLFYIQSLFFPPIEAPITSDVPIAYPPDHELWEVLHEIDAARASELHYNDYYRIKRALDIWYTTGNKPSEQQPVFQPIVQTAYVIHCTRDRKELYERINARVLAMFDQGWMEEACFMQGTPWEAFLHEKKIIGYDELLEHCSNPHSNVDDMQKMIASISQKTRNYAKRQETFWRMLQAKLLRAQLHNHDCTLMIDTLNLSTIKVDTSVDKVVKRLTESTHE